MDVKHKPKLLSVGALTQDTIIRLDRLPQGPGKFLPLEAVQIAAGMAASAACAAQRQGAEVTLWASLGDDRLADELLAGIGAEGVDCSVIRRVPGARSAIAAILVDAEGERMIVPYYDPRAQAAPDRLPFADLGGFDAVLADVRWPGATRLALDAARAAGIPAILDADVAPREVLLDLLPHATHIVASAPAAAILYGEDVAGAAAVRAFAGSGARFVAVTAGAAGTYWAEAGGEVRHMPAPAIVPVDTLAAGDIFHGSFAVSLAEGRDLAHCLAFASAAAALKCLKFGGRLGAPTRAETEAMLQSLGPC